MTGREAEPDRSPSPPGGAQASLGGLDMAALFSVTVGARLAATWAGGGFATNGIYDDGVYFTSAVRFVHGSWPYRDYLLLHPPGMTLLLAPFAWVGSLLGDATGYTLARLAMMVVAGLTTVLIASVAGRWGRASGWVAGLTYALFASSIYAGSTLFMEGVSSLAAMSALVLLTGGASSKPSWQRVVAAGLLLGLLPVIKVWNAPIAAVILLTAGRSRLLLAAGSALVSFAGLTLPFLLRDPQAMWRMVVSDQLGRPRFELNPIAKVANFLGYASDGTTDLHVEGLPLAATAALVALVGVIVMLAVRAKVNLVYVVLLVVCVGLVMTSALALRNYGELFAPWLAVLSGVAASFMAGPPRNRSRQTRALIGAVLVLVWLAILAVGAARPVGKPLPVEWLNQHLDGVGCVVTDDPVVLIATNRLSPQLEAGCPEIWVDVSGRTYDYAAHGQSGRTDNPVWQRVIYDYLTSADASVSCRRNTGISEQTLERLEPARIGGKSGCDLFVFAKPR